MKKSRFLFVGILIFFVQNLYSSNPDEWSGNRRIIFFSNWSVNLNVGLTSYFGDLSQYDLQLKNKLLFESKPAYGLKLTKQIRKIFGISGQLIFGGFKSDYRPEHSFETSLMEYSLQLGLDVINLILPKNTLKSGWVVYVGTGQFMFQTSRYMILDGVQSPNTVGTGVPEFVYFFGSEVYLSITDRINLTADLSIRQAQNDNIDKYLANGDFDYYSHLCFGVTYTFGKLYSPSKYESNYKLNKDSPVWRIDP